jgi:hypothetical protein
MLIIADDSLQQLVDPIVISLPHRSFIPQSPLQSDPPLLSPSLSQFSLPTFISADADVTFGFDRAATKMTSSFRLSDSFHSEPE